MKEKFIVVIGSSNTDMVVRAEHLPEPGETILGGEFFINAGGKGANQAVAAARLGGRVIFIAKTGNDLFGRQSIELFEEEGINTSYMMVDPVQASGVALITVDKLGENCIVVASGANAALFPSDLYKAEKVIRQAAVVLLQLEIPVETVAWVISTAAENGIRVILNPAPVSELPLDMLRKISIITPNETEASKLTGIKVEDLDSARKAAKYLSNTGIQTVIITLGSQGALLFHEEEYTLVEAGVVQAVDSTAAGDTFNGALAVSLSEGNSLLNAVRFACQAATISVTRWGAQSSIPRRHEIISN